jgi:SAM-dependent methyltransferase
MYIYQDNVSTPKEKMKNLKYNWKDKSVLELGCNIGKLGVMVKEAGCDSYMGIDISQKMVEIGKERYSLKLEGGDVEDYDLKADVIVAMALFHRFDDFKLERVIKKMDCEELIFEVPVGDKPDFEKYHCRTEEWYRDLVEKLFGEVIEVVDSGATNDPWNKRRIFYCKSNG